MLFASTSYQTIIRRYLSVAWQQADLQQADVFTENPMRIYMPLELLQRDVITTMKVIAASITIRLKK